MDLGNMPQVQLTVVAHFILLFYFIIFFIKFSLTFLNKARVDATFKISVPAPLKKIPDSALKHCLIKHFKNKNKPCCGPGSSRIRNFSWNRILNYCSGSSKKFKS